MLSLKVNESVSRYAVGDADVVAVFLENSGCLCDHTGHAHEGILAAEKRIDCAFVDNCIKKMVRKLQFCAVHSLQTKFIIDKEVKKKKYNANISISV